MLPQLDGVTHHFVELPGLRMQVAEAGSGEAVLMLHGFPQHWWEWRDVIPTLSQHYRVICPDLRGAGLTDAPPDGYTTDQLLADVLALLDELHLDRVHLLTHDWSGVLGFLLCLRHPERVRDHLVIAIPPPAVRPDRGFALRALRYGWFNLVLPWPGLGPWALRSGRLPRHMMRRHSTTMPEELIELFADQLRDPARARAGSALYRNFIQREGMRVLRGKYRDLQLTTPTRVLLGAEDLVVRAESIPSQDGIEVAEIAGAAHFLVDDRPDAVVEHALEFFQQE
ncbi:alpha/beta hydrolase [Kribbella capetownensis]|uniref:Alpha/beta hydrolase n=1 Tax=Kribbella capetownensis TaxID=1572659 RepID=A0A4R0JUZ7_9ACTN|nr:alpha/beta hydrolase [Kribbella capetownensis]TCC50004.1 alpha/beta hydrolase [Kribbella capetownensis]